MISIAKIRLFGIIGEEIGRKLTSFNFLSRNSSAVYLEGYQSRLREQINQDGQGDDSHYALDETGCHLLDDEDGNDDDEKREDVVGHFIMLNVEC